MRKNCCNDLVKLLKVEAESQEFVIILRLLDQMLKQTAFLTCSCRFLRFITSEKFKFIREQNNWDLEICRKRWKNILEATSTFLMIQLYHRVRLWGVKSWGSEASSSAKNYSKLAILHDYKHHWMHCIALQSYQSWQKFDF